MAENVKTLINENGFVNIWVNQYAIFNRNWSQQTFSQTIINPLQ